MAFNRQDHWVWDFWLADHGEQFHLFYLHAPKSLSNPDLRHRNARIGHATSSDLTNWTDHGLAFDAGPEGSFDGSAAWTGCVIRDDAGLWRMYYTGSRFLSEDSNANIETVGLATSPDLFSWTKQPGPICVADPELYETLGTSSWPEEAWRDPWVFRNEGDPTWQMLITGRAKTGTEPDRGVMAYATSPDLKSWTVQPALSATGAGFAHLEVFQVIAINGQNHLIFCCDTPKLCGPREGEKGGVWSLPVGDMPGQVDFSKARLLVPEQLYAGRVALTRNGEPVLLAFNNVSTEGAFIGGVSDPIPLHIDADGYLAVKA